MSAADRRSALADIIRGERIASQEALAERLRARGYEVTQATVSRDLEALGAIRARIDGQSAYALPPGGDGDEEAGALDRILAEWRLSVEAAGNLLVVRTRPGSAHVVGAALDAAALDGIAGTIAGDDTLFLAVRDGHDPKALARRLEGRSGSR